jgi:hypothetical protein
VDIASVDEGWARQRSALPQEQRCSATWNNHRFLLLRYLQRAFMPCASHSIQLHTSKFLLPMSKKRLDWTTKAAYSARKSAEEWEPYKAEVQQMRADNKPHKDIMATLKGKYGFDVS